MCIRDRNKGDDLILEIDWQGAAEIRRSDQRIIDIFILPPSIGSLQRRLTKRGQDDRKTIELRMAAALSEISHYDEFTYLIVNDRFETALSEIEDILDGKGERLSLKIQRERYKDLISKLTVKQLSRQRYCQEQQLTVNFCKTAGNIQRENILRKKSPIPGENERWLV